MGPAWPGIVLLLLVIQGSTYGKHFRGGSMSWKPVGNQIQLTYQVGFTVQMGSNEGDPCTPEAKENQVELKGSGYIECDSCSGDAQSQRLTWICDDYDSVEDSTYGHYTILYDVPQPEFEISYDSCCWVKLASPINTAPGAGASGWKMLAHVNLALRSDGRINSSPVSAHIPVEKFYKGCQYILRIPASDPDNDVVRCRYARTDEGECSSDQTKACGVPTAGLGISKKGCVLTFDTKAIDEGYHAVNVIIQDYERPFVKKKSKPLSKVSLLFLLLVDGESATCMKPTIIDPPRCKTVRPGERFEMIVRADPGEPSKPIAKIKTQKPAGMTSTDMVDDPAVPNRKMVTLSWDPTVDNIGETPVCFSALDEDGYTSGVSCTFIYVDDDPLHPVPETSHPAPNADAAIQTGETWTVQFNQEIQRPTTSAFIKIVDPGSGVVAFQIDAKNSSVVFNERSLDFVPSRDNLFSGSNKGVKQFELQLDEGVAMPNMGGCGSQAAQWQVNVQDTLPVSPRPPPELKPVPVECKTETLEVPNQVGEQGETCFIHLPEDTVVVSGGVINVPYKLCCPSSCEEFLCLCPWLPVEILDLIGDAQDLRPVYVAHTNSLIFLNNDNT